MRMTTWWGGLPCMCLVSPRHAADSGATPWKQAAHPKFDSWKPSQGREVLQAEVMWGPTHSPLGAFLCISTSGSPTWVPLPPAI